MIVEPAKVDSLDGTSVAVMDTGTDLFTSEVLSFLEAT